MGARKKVKKKKTEPKAAKQSDMDLEISEHLQLIAILRSQLEDAVVCLTQYTKKGQIGDLANPAIELLTKWGRFDAAQV